MLNTIKSYIEAAKARKEDGEKGFSLVELIVVVVILGILAAVAIPIFGGIQAKAEENAAKAATANFASQGVANLAMDADPAVPSTLDDLDGWTFSTSGTAVDTFCVTGTKGSLSFDSGPGC